MDVTSGPASERLLIHRFRDSRQDRPLTLPCSPFAVGLNGQVQRIDVASRRIVVAFHPGEHYVARPRGTLQGGALATMLDLSMVCLMIALTPVERTCATANLQVAYLRPAPHGPCVVEAQIERLGRTLGFARATLRSPDDRPAATATAIFSVFDAAPAEGIS